MRAATIAAACLALASCSEEEVPTYRVATDEPAPEKVIEGNRPLRWKAPDDWETETPGELQIALYKVGESGNVSVSKFPGDAGGIPANVNRWREEIGLPPSPDPGGQVISLEAGGSRAMWFELRGEDNSILAAIVPVNDETWFFKLTTPGSALENIRPAFMELLKSIEIGEKPVPPRISLEVPQGWEKQPATDMRAASFRIPSPDGIDGDVSVIPLPGDGGSDLENVNRWRAQLRLPPTESDIGQSVKGESGDFLLTRMVSAESLFSDNRKGAITTAILRKNGFTWFFKIAGEAEMVRAQDRTFESFVSSAIFP